MSYVYDFDESVYENDDDEGYGGPDAYVAEHDDDYVEEEEEEEEEEDDDLQLDAEDELERLVDESDNREALQAELEDLVSEELLHENTYSNTEQTRNHTSTTIDIGQLLRGGTQGTQFNSVINLLTQLGAIRSNTLNVDDEDDENEERDTDPRTLLFRRRRRNTGRTLKPAPSWWRTPYRSPQSTGVQLLLSGEFGRVGVKRRAYLREKWRMDEQGNMVRDNRERPELERGNGEESQNVHPKYKLDFRIRSIHSRTRYMPREDLVEELVPNTNGTVVASYGNNVYCGQYSTDSSFYYVCRKDYILHIYDMNAPRYTTPVKSMQIDHQTTLKEMKSVRCVEAGWTITDSHLSPSNDRMVYSAMGSKVYMVKTLEPDETQIALDFQDPHRRRRGVLSYYDDDYVIWTCRFSADGNEVIAGGQRSIYVYDLLANRRTVKIHAHEDDVNSCCWADAGSNVLVSASDDSFLKIWDRRSLGSSQKPSGVLIGHTEGITYVSAKGDGRYLISNGKDQALRLWDMRKMRSNQEYEEVKDELHGISGFDYRYMQHETQTKRAHPKDCSLMAYRGHSVMRTLIRCHFSPAETTGGSYLYSGSADGRIYIWSVDGRLVQVLDRLRSFPITFDPAAKEYAARPVRGSRDWNSAVRDVSWHSQRPVLMSAAWGHRSTVAEHEWKGLDRLGGRIEDWVEKAIAEAKNDDELLRRRAFSDS